MRGLIHIVLLAVFLCPAAAHAQTQIQTHAQMLMGAPGPSPLTAGNPGYTIPGVAQTVDTRATDDDRDPLKNPIFTALSRGMQNQLMDEAQTYHGDCNGRIVYAAMHDCNCLSVHYLNERLKQPDASVSTLTQTIVNDCIDQAAIAGYSYSRCVDIYSSSYPDIIKPLCECYGRRYAREFARHPNDNSDAEVALGVRVQGECRTYLQSFAPDLSTPGTPPAQVPASGLHSLKR